MTKELYVQSIRITRRPNVPQDLFMVILKGLTKKEPLHVFMYADEIVRTLTYDSSFRIIIADTQTKKLLVSLLTGSSASNFKVLEENKYILLDS